MVVFGRLDEDLKPDIRSKEQSSALGSFGASRNYKKKFPVGWVVMGKAGFTLQRFTSILDLRHHCPRVL
jgi:hypothetical protein